MNGKYKKMKQAAKQQGKIAKQTGKTIKRGAKSIARGKRKLNSAIKAQSKEKGQPSQRNRYRAMDAEVMISEGEKAMANPTPKAKLKKRAYRTAPASGHGPNKYVTKKGKVVTRKKRR